MPLWEVIVEVGHCFVDPEDLWVEEGVGIGRGLEGSLDLEDRSSLVEEGHKEGSLGLDQMHLEGVGQSLFQIADVVDSSPDQGRTVGSEEDSREEGREIGHDSGSEEDPGEGPEKDQKEEDRVEKIASIRSVAGLVQRV